MEMKEKRIGYSKKSVIIAIGCVIAAGIIFYAGAKYEKHKLSSLGLLNNGNDCSQTQTAKKSKKTTTAPLDNSTINTDQNAANPSNSTVDSNSTTLPSNAPAVSAPKTTTNPSSVPVTPAY